jgi:hypothetical protein
MDQGSVRESLSQHVDQLTAGVDNTTLHLSAQPAIQDELESLFTLIRRLRMHLRALTTEPSPAFQEGLRIKLVAAATQQALHQGNGHHTSFYPAHRRGILFGAAALGSLVSVAVFVVASRSRTHSNSKSAA